jgi:hypothetical protein
LELFKKTYCKNKKSGIEAKSYSASTMVPLFSISVRRFTAEAANAKHELSSEYPALETDSLSHSNLPFTAVIILS